MDDQGSFEDYRLDATNILPYEAYSETKARQRASILWLVSKAYNHRIPSDLREPCYRDHEGEERLKPQIIHSLSNAELYCLALANIYADPNYHSLNHHGVLQVLMRKGVDVIEPPDASLTETVLVQTAPIRMSAHMAVIESIMALYIKEVLIPEKVVEVVRRFSVLHSQSELPADAEDAALFWINKSSIKMRHRIEEELGTCRSPDEGDLSMEDYRVCCTAVCRKPTLHSHTFLQTGRHIAPSIPLAQDLSDLSDGCCLAALLCFYCPRYLHWQDVRLSDSSSLADSVYNLQLVQRFCQEYLPHDIHFLSLEDFIYLHSSVRQNVLALIADLMYLFEIRPAKCVSRPGFKEEVDHALVLEAPKRLNQNGQPPQVMSKPRSFRHTRSPIPDLRSGAFGGSNCSLPDMSRASPHSNGSWQQRERMSGKQKRMVEGVRSSHQPPLRRANSMTEAQKGGQEHQNLPHCVDKLEEDEELAEYFSQDVSSTPGVPKHRRTSGQAASTDSDQITEPLFPTHVKVLKEKNNHDTKRQERGEEYIMPLGTNLNSEDRPSSRRVHDSKLDLSHDDEDDEEELVNNQMLPLQSKAEMDEDDVRIKAGLQDYYSQLGTEHPNDEVCDVVLESKTLSSEKISEGYDKEKAMLEITDPYDINLYNEVKDMKGHNLTTSFADLCKLKKSPSSSINIVYMQMNNNDGNNKLSTKSNPGGGGSESGNKETEQESESHTANQHVNNISQGEGDSSIQSQMYNLRLKLEERRKKIEKEKKKVENIYRHQRQRLGKAAFLQAVTKGTVSEASTPDSNTSKELPLGDVETEVSQETVQDIAEDLNMVKKQWFLQNGSGDGPRRDLSENGQQGVNAEDFQSSIEQLNSSLTDLQVDIASLSSQQEMIKKMMNVQPSQLQQEGKFFLHEQQNRPDEDIVPAARTSWRNQPYSNLADTPTSPRRGQWGQPVMQMAEQSPQRQHWQTAPPVMRPASVEPQMMSGHPMTMQTQQYDQRPPSAVPFMESSRQGFSLQPVRSEMYPGYDYRYQPHSLYPNGPVESIPHGQYGYNQYPSLPSHSYGSLQNIPPDQYGNMMYSAQPPPIRSYPQNQQHPFRLQQEASHSLSMPPTSQYQPPPQPITRVPQEISSQHFEHSPRTDTNTSHVEAAQEDLTAVTDEFGRPVGAVRMSSSPPNKPVLGKTFRISKPKVTSPPSTQELPVSEAETVNTNQTQNESLDTADVDKGFYISFDDNQPRKPKPKLRPRQVKARQQQKRAEADATGDDIKNTGTNSSQVSPNSSAEDTAPSTDTVKASPVEQNSKDAVMQPGVGFVIGADFVSPNPDAELEMARRKEMIMMISLRRRVDQESKRLAKEQEYAWQREQERAKKETQEKKKEEEKLRRQLILEQYRQRKMQEEAEKEGGSTGSGSKDSSLPNSRAGTLTRPKTRSASASRPRPKSIHVGSGSHDSLASNLGTGTSFPDDNASVHSLDFPSPRKPASGTTRHLLSPTQSSGHFPGSHPPLPLNLLSARYKGSGPPSDGASDTNSTTSSITAAEYTGPKLFVKPTTKSNRGIILNAINTVLAGAVNSETKKRVLEEINRSESKHFLILFRDAGCQYRAIYSYNPETEEVLKLNGIGPKAVTDHMMDRFFKYNSGGKCFTEVHTKHLTVTIDAFTIHNNLWSGKRAPAPKKDLF